MKLLIFTAASVAAVSALSLPRRDQALLNHDVDKYLVELAPGETRWVTEDEKWDLRRVIAHLFEQLLRSASDIHIARDQLFRHH